MIPLHQVKSSSLRQEETHHYTLALYLSNGLIANSIFDPVSKMHLALKSFQLDNQEYNGILSRIQDSFEELFQPFKKNILVYNGPKFTLVPEMFMEKEDLAEKYFTLNFEKDEGEIIRYSKLPTLGAFIIYSIPQEVLRLEEILHPDAVYFSRFCSLEAGLRYKAVSDPVSIFIDIEQGYFSVTVFRFNSLHLCNSYLYSGPEDIMYHILNISKNFNISPDADQYYISGLIEQNSRLFNLLYKYLRNPVFCPPAPGIQTDSCFNDIPLHTYNNLLSVAVCE